MINWVIGFLTDAALIKGPQKLDKKAISNMIRSESVSMIESLIELIAEQIVPAEQRDVVVPKLTDFLRKIL